MSKRRRIRTPLRRRWQLFRTRALPVVIWLGAAGAVVMLWRHRTTRLDAPGIIKARQAVVSPAERGTIVSLMTDLYEEVRRSQVVAMLDDTAVHAALAVAEAEVKRLQATLLATERQLQEDAALRELDLFNSSRTYAMRIQQLRLEKLSRKIELENDQVELQRLAAAVERCRALRTSAVIAEQQYDDTRYEHEALGKKIKATEEALAVIEGQLREAITRQESPRSDTGADRIAVALGPLREELTVQLKRVDEIKVQREALLLTSPLDGVVTAVYRREGETVMAGEAVLAVADPRSMQIVSFVEPGNAVEPTEGMWVEVRRRNTRPVQVARARVAKVGLEVEPIPQAVLGNSPVLRWGVRVLIDMPASMFGRPAGGPLGAFIPPRPGELLDIRYFVPVDRGRQPNVPRGPGSAL